MDGGAEQQEVGGASGGEQGSGASVRGASGREGCGAAEAAR